MLSLLLNIIDCNYGLKSERVVNCFQILYIRSLNTIRYKDEDTDDKL